MLHLCRRQLLLPFRSAYVHKSKLLQTKYITANYHIHNNIIKMSYKTETGTFETPFLHGQDGKKLKLFYQRWIPANPKPGFNMVLHHGIGEHCDRYGNVLGMLEGTGCTLYSYDARGHGRSEGKKGLAKDLGQFADDLTVFIDFVEKEHNVSKPILYGHSMGGAVVLEFVGRSQANQDKIKAVIATAPALGVEKNCYQTVMSSLLACLRKIIPSVTLPSGVETHKLSRDTNVTEAFKNDPMTHDMISVSLAFSFLEDGPANTIPSAQRMTLPVYLAHGDKDVITDPKGTQQYYELCASKDKTFNLYPNLQHEIHNELKEDKEKVLADLKAFILNQM